MLRIRTATLVLLVLVSGFSVGTIASRANSQPAAAVESQGEKAMQAADYADFIPDEAVTVVAMRPADALAGKFLGTLRANEGKLLFAELKDQFRANTGVELDEVALFLLVITPGSTDDDARLIEIIVTKTPVDREYVLGYRRVIWEEVQAADGQSYYRSEEDITAQQDEQDEIDRSRVQAIAFPEPNVVVATSEDMIAKAFVKDRETRWRDLLSKTPRDTVASAVLRRSEAEEQQLSMRSLGPCPLPVAINPLYWDGLQARTARWDVSFDGDVLLSLALQFENQTIAKETAERFGSLLDGTQTLAESGLDSISANLGEEAAGLLKSAIRATKITQQENTVRVDVPRPEGFGPDAFRFVVGEIDKERSLTRKQGPVDEMRQVGIAIHNFHDVNAGLPPGLDENDQKHRDKNGRMYLSWRVHLLPYLDEQELYEQFHLDEPWDSEHNIKLLAKMPNVLRLDPNLRPGYSDIIAPYGPRTILGGQHALTLRQILDGSSNTMLTVQAAPDHAVPWTKPDDFEFDPNDKDALQRFGHPEKSFFYMMLADAWVIRVRRSVNPRDFQYLIDYADGKAINMRAMMPDPDDLDEQNR